MDISSADHAGSPSSTKRPSLLSPICQVLFALTWAGICLWTLTRTNDQVFVILNLCAFLGFAYGTALAMKDLLAVLRRRQMHKQVTSP